MAAVEELTARALRINRNILSMRSEGCDLSVPISYRPRAACKARAWWWFLEAPMHVSGGNPYILPEPHWMNCQLAGTPATAETSETSETSETRIRLDPIP